MAFCEHIAPYHYADVIHLQFKLFALCGANYVPGANICLLCAHYASSIRQRIML